MRSTKIQNKRVSVCLHPAVCKDVGGFVKQHHQSVLPQMADSINARQAQEHNISHLSLPEIRSKSDIVIQILIIGLCSHNI